MADTQLLDALDKSVIVADWMRRFRGTMEVAGDVVTLVFQVYPPDTSDSMEGEIRGNNNIAALEVELLEKGVAVQMTADFCTFLEDAPYRLAIRRIQKRENVEEVSMREKLLHMALAIIRTSTFKEWEKKYKIRMSITEDEVICILTCSNAESSTKWLLGEYADIRDSAGRTVECVRTDFGNVCYYAYTQLLRTGEKEVEIHFLLRE